MQEQIQISPKEGCIGDSTDAKYISGLSTILVATIQEAKDRISQIEYIFCSQIYPNFQSNSKSLQKIYSEARKVAEDAWSEKEKEMTLEMKQLQLEKQQAVEENQSLKFEKAKLLQEQEEKMDELLVKLERQQCKINELEQELAFKSKEVEGGKEMQKGLIQLAQSKACEIKKKCDQLEEREGKTKTLVAELNSQKKKVDVLQQELGEKTEQAAKEKELTENLFKKIEKLSLDILHNEQLLADEMKQKKFLIAKLEGLEENVSRFQESLAKKTKEVEEAKKLHEHLIVQIKLESSEMSKNKHEFEKEKRLLLDKVKGLEEKVNELKINHSDRSGDGAGGRDLNEKLLQQLEQTASEFMAEKKKRRDVIDAYKRLKSQYNYLCAKFGLTTVKMLPENKVEEESDSSRQQRMNPIAFPDLKDEKSDVSAVESEINKAKQEVNSSDILDNEKGAKSIQTSSFRSPTSGFTITEKCPSNVKSAPAAGTKRPASSWRETRSRQFQGGPDPHDDFLDTPLENIRGNLNKAMKEQVHDRPDPAAKDMNLDCSDDETQDMNVDPDRQRQQNPGPTAAKPGFKYVEPVRKKAERENLKGVECKQCKKFYDAVLPNGGKESDGSKQTLRCEHHEGVSRHRYKYVPPMTPEGFWNIGFESEM